MNDQENSTRGAFQISHILGTSLRSSETSARELLGSSTNQARLIQREEVESLIEETDIQQSVYNFAPKLYKPSDSSASSSSTPFPESRRTLPSLPKSLSTSIISAEQYCNKGNQPDSIWHWEIIDTENEYVPSFYHTKRYHSDGSVPVAYKHANLLRIPNEHTRYTQNSRVGNERESRLSSPLQNKHLTTKRDIGSSTSNATTRINTCKKTVYIC
uniref:Uncharacterized protein n=1 Tax=Trichobilharzia regenti TaxID=157069 RepID=A0AA85JAH8_TRIRE|nr:unnamed protein product [Trichobilharzia regenti]